jgi:hypothetical protein
LAAQTVPGSIPGVCNRCSKSSFLHFLTLSVNFQNAGDRFNDHNNSDSRVQDALGCRHRYGIDKIVDGMSGPAHRFSDNPAWTCGGKQALVVLLVGISV